MAALVVVLLLFGGGVWFGWRVYRARQMIELLELQRAKESEARARAAADEARAQAAAQQEPRAAELP